MFGVWGLCFVAIGLTAIREDGEDVSGVSRARIMMGSGGLNILLCVTLENTSLSSPSSCEKEKTTKLQRVMVVGFGSFMGGRREEVRKSGRKSWRWFKR
jgi:hypothetical protein